MGNHRSGRPPIPTVEHAQRGTFRADRHANRADQEVIGEPVKPPGLCDVASAFWDAVVPDLVERGLADQLDTSGLEVLARTWGLLQSALSMAEEAPIDRDARISVTGYMQRFESIAGRYGLTPVDRARLKVEPRPVKHDEAAEFFADAG